MDRDKSLTAHCCIEVAQASIVQMVLYLKKKRLVLCCVLDQPKFYDKKILHMPPDQVCAQRRLVGWDMQTETALGWQEHCILYL